MMRRWYIRLSMVLAAASGRALAAQTGPAAAAAAIMDSMADAVQRQDGAKMLRSYDDSAIYSSHGLMVRSKRELEPVYGAWDSTKTRGTYLKWIDRRFQVLAPDLVLGTSRLKLAPGNPKGQPTDTVTGTWTGVFIRRGSRWALLHEHESFAPPRRKPAGG